MAPCDCSLPRTTHAWVYNSLNKTGKAEILKRGGGRNKLL